MQYQVSTDDTVVNLTVEQLLDTLLAKIKDTRKEDLEVLSTSLANYLQANQIITDMKVLEILYTGMIIGYYYKVFLSNNKVVINNETNSN